eukprot:TRINITY_DN8103_c0_g1_i1.p1 TRINITY_DN8103_c0_g1~~TRINITY_DN8103_c0_g1_i1.p1  ORF type:complete len:778 (+),score=151.65 TRINITY_DN8103_c0_g1_i1:325-2334(+)
MDDRMKDKDEDDEAVLLEGAIKGLLSLLSLQDTTMVFNNLQEWPQLHWIITEFPNILRYSCVILKRHYSSFVQRCAGDLFARIVEGAFRFRPPLLESLHNLGVNTVIEEWSSLSGRADPSSTHLSDLQLMWLSTLHNLTLTSPGRAALAHYSLLQGCSSWLCDPHLPVRHAALDILHLLSDRSALSLLVSSQDQLLPLLQTQLCTLLEMAHSAFVNKTGDGYLHLWTAIQYLGVLHDASLSLWHSMHLRSLIRLATAILNSSSPPLLQGSLAVHASWIMQASLPTRSSMGSVGIRYVTEVILSVGAVIAQQDSISHELEEEWMATLLLSLKTMQQITTARSLGVKLEKAILGAISRAPLLHWLHLKQEGILALMQALVDHIHHATDRHITEATLQCLGQILASAHLRELLQDRDKTLPPGLVPLIAALSRNAAWEIRDSVLEFLFQVFQEEDLVGYALQAQWMTIPMNALSDPEDFVSATAVKVIQGMSNHPSSWSQLVSSDLNLLNALLSTLLRCDVLTKRAILSVLCHFLNSKDHRSAFIMDQGEALGNHLLGAVASTDDWEVQLCVIQFYQVLHSLLGVEALLRWKGLEFLLAQLGDEIHLVRRSACHLLMAVLETAPPEPRRLVLSALGDIRLEEVMNVSRPEDVYDPQYQDYDLIEEPTEMDCY